VCFEKERKGRKIQLICNTAAPAETENKKAGREDDKVDFGKGFSKNLRGAFM
jgi:hypothetical protein